MVRIFTKLVDFYFHLKWLAVGVCCVSLKFFEINSLTIDFTKKNILNYFLGAFGILFIIPNVKMKTFEETDGVTSKKLTMKDLLRVCTYVFILRI